MAIRIVSSDATGNEGNGASYTSIGGARVSDDGRFVVFYSQATNLAAGDLNGATYFDAFLKDMQTGAVSILATSATGHSSAEAITADGRFALVLTDAVLSPGDTNGSIGDTYIKDLQTGSVSLLIGGANNQVVSTSMTPDGRHVAFWTSATNIAPGDTNGSIGDIFVKNTVTGAISLLTPGANNHSSRPSISADGRFTTFSSKASNLAANDTTAGFIDDIFIHDAVSGQIRILTPGGNASSYEPVISADGTKVAFWSNATNLVAGAVGFTPRVYVADVATGALTVVAEGGGVSNMAPSISGDGRFIAFASGKSDLVPGDPNGTTADIFVADTLTGRIALVTPGANSLSENPTISKDGRHIVFYSHATNLAAGDTNSQPDVFLADNPLLPDTVIQVVSPGAPTFQSTSLSSTPLAPNVTSNFAWTGSGAAPAVASGATLYPPTHTLAGINDGVYGNSSSFIRPAPFWVKIDLGTDRVFDQVSLGRDRTGFFNDRDPGQFRIYAAMDDVYAMGSAADDADEYTLVYDSTLSSYSGLVNGPQTVTASFAPVFARYVKVEFYTGTSFLEPAIDEIQVRSSTGLGGNDTFIASGVHLVSGTSIDGGAGTDTLRIEGGGTVDLTAVTLTSIEAIELMGSAGTTVIVADAAQAALVSGAGSNDQVQIASGGAAPTPGEVKDLIDAGVEVVRWSIPGYATVVAEAEAGGFHIHYTDTPGDGVNHPFATIDVHYNAAGQKTHQSQLFDSAGSVGMIANHTFDPATGLATQVKYLDGGSNRTFDTITTTLVDGVVQSVRTVNDNNTATLTDDTIVDQEYSGGRILREITQDTGGSKPWSQVVREYENGGVLHSTVQVFRTHYDSSANQHVSGTAGSQVIEGGTGNDALIGGAGGDTFRFLADFGQDTIYDFVSGTDKLDLTAFGIDTLAELDAVAAITQVGANTVIQFDGADERITIRSFAAGNLTSSDFVLDT